MALSLSAVVNSLYKLTKGIMSDYYLVSSYYLFIYLFIYVSI